MRRPRRMRDCDVDDAVPAAHPAPARRARERRRAVRRPACRRNRDAERRAQTRRHRHADGRETRSPSQHVEHERRVCDRARHRSDVIERPAQRHDAVGRNLPGAGLRPTMPHAADGMRIEPPVSVPSAPNAMPAASADRRPAARPAGRSRRVPGIAHRPERRFLAGRAERELVQVGLADDDGARVAQTLDDRRIDGRFSAGGSADPDVVRVPATSTRSFTATGMPCSGPR